MPTDFVSRYRRSLIAATALCTASCAEIGSDTDVSQDDVLSSNGFAVNGFAVNGFAVNGFAVNGFAVNGFAVNGLSANGLSMNTTSTTNLSLMGLMSNGLLASGPSFIGLAAGGLSSTGGMMTTPGGREIVKYLVACAFPNGHNLTARDQYDAPYTFTGSLGVAPEAEFGTCDATCQERISGCMLAHVNNAGVHVGIWLVGPDNGIGWGSSPNFPYKEAAYFGNLFQTMQGYYCAGKDMGSGDVKGRMGSPFGNNNNVLRPAYGEQWDGATAQNVPQYCTTGTPSTGCTVMNEGYSQCTDPSATHSGPWTHPVTVWRNFEATQLYKICNKQTSRCLGVVGGSTTENANVEQRTFTGAAGQTWQLLQVSPGNYKVVNKTSGRVLDLNGSQVVQRAYTGTASQILPLTYLPSEPGFANLKMSSTTSVFQPYGSYNDGALIKLTTNSTASDTKWSFIAISLATFDPGVTYRLVPQHATGESIDIPNGMTSPGTIAQQYFTWNTDTQKFFIADAGNGNVKLKLKLNANKCLGPLGNSTANGTRLEVQDCNGSYGQAWVTAEKSGAPGVLAFRNAAAPTLCMDVVNGMTGNGTQLDLWTCNGALNQQFAAQVAP